MKKNYNGQDWVVDKYKGTAECFYGRALKFRLIEIFYLNSYGN